MLKNLKNMNKKLQEHSLFGQIYDINQHLAEIAHDLDILVKKSGQH